MVWIDVIDGPRCISTDGSNFPGDGEQCSNNGSDPGLKARDPIHLLQPLFFSRVMP